MRSEQLLTVPILESGEQHHIEFVADASCLVDDGRIEAIEIAMLGPHARVHPRRIVDASCAGRVLTDIRSQPIDRFLARPVSVFANHDLCEATGTISGLIERGDRILNTRKGAWVGRVPVLRRPFLPEVIDTVPETVRRLRQVCGVESESGPSFFAGDLQDASGAEMGASSTIRMI